MFAFTRSNAQSEWWLTCQLAPDLFDLNAESEDSGNDGGGKDEASWFDSYIEVLISCCFQSLTELDRVRQLLASGIDVDALLNSGYSAKLVIEAAMSRTQPANGNGGKKVCRNRRGRNDFAF